MTRHKLQSYLKFFVRTFSVPGLLLLVLSSLTVTPASASAPERLDSSYTSIAAAPEGGFWIQRDPTEGGGTLAIGGAPQYESVEEYGSIAAIPGKRNHGYWVVTAGGGIHARGGARELCSGKLQNCSGFNTDKDKLITAAAASPDGMGLWAVDNARHVWTAGNTVSYGDVTSDDRTPTGIVATPSGKGYYIVMDDGGVHARGDAVFYGSTGGNRPGGHHITGIALSQTASGEVNGYWLLADDGAVYTFGDAMFLGNGGVYSKYATSIVARPGGNSYAWVFADGHYGFSETLPIAEIASVQWNTVWSLPNQNGPGTPIDLRPTTALGTTLLQQWRLWPTSSDGKFVQLVNLYSGLCADVTDNGGNLHLIQWPCKGKNEGWDNQRFRILSDNTGRHQLLPVSPGNTTVVGEASNSVLGLRHYQEGWWDLPATWGLTTWSSKSR